MAFDGITVCALVDELNKTLTGGRIFKVAQPESDELLLTVKNEGTTYRLVISVNASVPLVYLTDENRQSPPVAPSFCMLLRKHIQNGRIISVSQPSLERIITLNIEHMDEMGDLAVKKLIIELMGKHSNIIFTDKDNVIMDSIKHVGYNISSIRQVLPGMDYFVPESIKKADPLNTDRSEFAAVVSAFPHDIPKAVSQGYAGISYFTAQMVFSSQEPSQEPDIDAAFFLFNELRKKISEKDFAPEIYFENNEPFEYSVLKYEEHGFKKTLDFKSISALLVYYYREKEKRLRIRQKSADLRKIVATLLEKDIKKYDIHSKQLSDTQKKDKYRVYGELLNTYGYNVSLGSDSVTVPNYYTGEDLTIPLDPQLSALENSKKYFDRYNKLKRTEEAARVLLSQTEDEIKHLESVQNFLEMASSEDDLSQIKEELVKSGYIKKGSGAAKKAQVRSKPLHYLTKEGFHIYVGKNNIQNEYITFEVANGNDWWFHAKKIPGSHVIVKTEGKKLPDSVFEDAARLAAHYSKAGGSSRVEVDYVLRKEVKHPNGSKPGFVVYYTNYSMLIDTDISGLSLIDG